MSLTSTPVSEVDVARAAKAIMKEWLESYFDGDEHDVGNTEDVDFPLVPIRFDQSPSTQPMAGGEIRVLLALKRQRDWADRTGRRAMVDAEWTLDVRAAVSGVGQANYLANRVADLVYAILNQPLTRYAIAEKGVQVHSVRQVETASSNDYALRRIVARGLLHYELG